MFRNREVHVLRRPYKRSLGLTLQVSGRIRISAPKSTPLARIEEFLLSHADWIETHLEKYSVLRSAYPPKRYVDGERFLFLGDEVTLRFIAGTSAKFRFTVQEGRLVVQVPPSLIAAGFVANEPHPELADEFVAFYRREGKRIIGERLVHFSERMGLKPTSVCFRAQKTRWGSCSARGKISLNWRLIVAPLNVIDYVVVHELAHLRHYNHSASFWNLVGTQLADYDIRRQWLRDHQYEADFLAKRSELHPS